MQTIQKGSKGDDVKFCQEWLTLHGFPVTADGVFGSGTESKVMQFQRARKLSVDGVVGPGTWKALLSTPTGASVPPPTPLPWILVELRKRGHEVVWKGDYHLNLFGIRSKSRQANSFDDTLGVAFTVNGLWKVSVWPGTTDPGLYHLQNPGKVEGTAILVAGQYKDVWKIDLHNGQYEALCQRNGDVKVYRDADRDGTLDMDPSKIQTGSFGINLHRSSSGGSSTTVDKWSAGCQVHARTDGFDEMMALAHRQVEKLGLETFTYTLIDE